MKRIDQQEIENENKNETGAVLPQGPPQENPSWENDPNTKRTYKTSYNLIRGVAEPILRHLILGFLLLRAQVARRKSSGSHTRQRSGDRRLGGGGSSKKVWFITGAALWGKVADGSWEGAPPSLWSTDSIRRGRTSAALTPGLAPTIRYTVFQQTIRLGHTKFKACWRGNKIGWVR